MYSPLAGHVGQYVQLGTRLITIVPVTSVYLEANFKETQAGGPHADRPAGGAACRCAQGHGSARRRGKLYDRHFTKIVQRVPVRIRVDTGPETRKVLLPGLSVTVDIDTKSASDDSKRIEAENRHE